MKQIIRSTIYIVMAISSIIFIERWLISSPNYLGPTTEYFNGTKFENIYHSSYLPNHMHISDFFRPSIEWPSNIPVRTITSEHLESSNDHVKFTFINHSSWLIQYPNTTILIDPVFADRISPIPFFGPKRHHSPPFELINMPTIDIIFISHNHYDHMDKKTIKFLISRDSPVCVSGIGTHSQLMKWGCQTVVGLDWFETYIHDNDFLLTFTPSQHFSNRGLFDRNTSLWGGLVIHYKNQHTTYYSGDTAYSDIFQLIAQRFPKIDVSILPISGESHYLSSQSHATPLESVHIHKDLSSKQSLASNWGTYQLTKDDFYQPIKDLANAKQQLDVMDQSFIHLIPGQQFLSELNQELITVSIPFD